MKHPANPPWELVMKGIDTSLYRIKSVSWGDKQFVVVLEIRRKKRKNQHEKT